MERFPRRLWLWLAVLAALTPIGIVLPRVFHAKDAWGEWGPETLARVLGYLPQGLKRTAESWRAPLVGYTIEPMNRMFGEIGSYVASALIGSIVLVLFAYVLGRLCANRRK